VDLQMLEEMLKTSVEPVSDSDIDFQTMFLVELINYILDKHHVYTVDEMHRLEGLVEKVVDAHAANHPELLSIRDLLQQLFSELKAHMFKEEQILFPFVVQLEESALQNRPVPFVPFGPVNNPIRMMMIEHENAGQMLRELRGLTNEYKVP